MEVASAIGILLVLAASPCAERAWGQRPPCRQCDQFRDPPVQEIRAHCIYPCECENEEPLCDPGVATVRDGCGCCPICPRQLGQPCDKTAVCDEHRGLFCHYSYIGASVGVCQGKLGRPCTVANATYSHGETFHVDCRTQCTCQNGTYACSSLCPNENISPRAACEHPRLVDVPDQCCREWMCDSTEAEHPPSCKQEFTSWSDCSAKCGLGASHRVSNVNGCVLMNETRICQLRPCEAGMLASADHSRHHHIRKGHECKATQRVAGPVHLRFGPCKSRKRYRPRFCGHCADRAYDGCCTPQLSTTIRVEFICEESVGDADTLDIMDLLETGRDLWWPDDLLALKIVKPTTSSLFGNDSQLESSVGAAEPHIFSSVNDNFDDFRRSVGWSAKTVKSPVDNTIVDRTSKIRDPEQDVYHLDRPLRTTEYSVENRVTESTTKTSTEENTTTKPRKRKKKKPRKPFTSWLEFRDEEYQMDEYEDYEEDSEERPKRSTESRKRSSRRNRRHTSDDAVEKPSLRVSDVKEKDSVMVKKVAETENIEDSRWYSRHMPLSITRRRRSSLKDRDEEILEIRPNKKSNSRLKSESDFKMWRTIKSHMSRGKDKKETGRKAQRRWRDFVDKKKNKRRRKVDKRVGARGNSVDGTPMSYNHLSKMERIMRGRNHSSARGSVTRLKKLAATDVLEPGEPRRQKRSVPPWVRPDPFSADGHSVSFNVQWIVKCACDRACALATTTPSELSADGEIVLRRVHRTAPP